MNISFKCYKYEWYKYTTQKTEIVKWVENMNQLNISYKCQFKHKDSERLKLKESRNMCHANTNQVTGEISELN